MRWTARRALAVSSAAVVGLTGVGAVAWNLPDGGVASFTAASGRPAPRGVGAAKIGTTDYKVPRDAVVVSPSGDDNAKGTLDAPVATLNRAVDAATDGATIVLRGGTYHETVELPAGKRLTVQSYPGEAVWLDGSSPVGDWRAEDGAWVRDGWTARFDHSPSYTKGAPADPDPDFSFVSPKHPMAAHPDQVWIDGVAQRQVGSRDGVRGGTFYVDEAAQRLYLGSDPRGRDVRASTLDEAVTVRSDGSVLRGVGVRRYATSLPQLGAVKVAAKDVRIENVAVTDCATTGLSVLSSGARVEHLTTTRNGLLGVHANQADDLVLDRVLATRNNLEHFKYSPVSGGIKVTRSRDVRVTDGAMLDNLGKGVWLDESVDGITITGDRIAGNADHGISLELSAAAVVANNLVRDNGGTGLKVNNTANVKIWNNTFVGNQRTVHLVQDPRSPDDPSTPGRDPRRDYPDPDMTWRLGGVDMSDNLLAVPRDGAPCLLCVEDATGRRGGGDMDLALDGNVYVRRSVNRPAAAVLWPTKPGRPESFDTLAAFRSGTGQERAGRAEDSAAPDDGPDAWAKANAKAARPLPEDVARLVGKPAGTRRIGAWLS
ncbi:right-handed parallel beta-helix repeat-containing protein [Actinomadura atramentaria]|uniref:right-handed parallel beta-helix repeat-containing protein n=1 Tax=Actinomadura atramentaria TaxID=1990 RepID=UPI00037207BF|nr:right-handed parallel beta-helix repeat-containing protein [Actinomadura atramentaria]